MQTSTFQKLSLNSSNNNAVILAIDPGIERTGWAVMQKGLKGPVLINAGLISTPSSMEFADRLKMLHEDICALVQKFNPCCAVLEKLFFTKASPTVSLAVQARGVILLGIRQHNVYITDYSPSQIKKTVCGNGMAKKPQMQKAVQLILNLKEIPKPDDVADAMAIGITHIKIGAVKTQMLKARAVIEAARAENLKKIKFKTLKTTK